MCGWSLDPSHKLRPRVIKALDLDIVCLCETFLRDDMSISIEGYRWFGNNRKSISKRARRGSGGVGILIKESILSQYDIVTIFENFEGILWLQLINRQSRKQVGICVCYLPPAGSSRGDKSQEFFDSLKSLIIDNYHMGSFLICGDLNARCGILDDAPGSDEIPTRIVVDKISNQFGKELIEMLRALELCILNGRFDPTKDNFTSVSTKGLSVVDYCIIPNAFINLFENFHVQDVHDSISNGIPIDSTIPDHRILTVEFKHALTPLGKATLTQPAFIRKVPPTYMRSAAATESLGSLAANLLMSSLPVDVDSVYNSFCKIIDEQLETRTVKHSKGAKDFNKAWWTEELKSLVKKVRCALKAWERDKAGTELKLAYLNSQKMFSKLVRKSKRQLRSERQMKLLVQQSTKPKYFWNFIKDIGSNRHALPTAMQRADGTVVSNPEEALNTWKDYFCDLLNPKASHKVQNNTHPIESLQLDASELNEGISYEEVRQAVYANNDAKSPGFDQIKPLFIKNEVCVHFLHSLFNYCFQHGVVPNAWFKNIIKPIPKSNPHSPSPSDYRGISLQSFVAKTYCRILNSRLREWLEHNKALSDEQNGFRSDRCCQDHTFALTSIIENRMAGKEDTFTCFIDFKKSF